jgi:putative hemolysin
MLQKGLSSVLVIVLVVGALALAAGAYYMGTQKSASVSNQSSELQTLENTQKSGVYTMASSNPKASSTSQLANPASENCIKQGGTLTIKKLADGGEYGLCNFEDDMACEEWALMRGECPKGGVKTTGFTTEAQKYCAWLGGQTLAVKDANCKLPSGKTCLDEDLYNGKCSPN